MKTLSTSNSDSGLSSSYLTHDPTEQRLFSSDDSISYVSEKNDSSSRMCKEIRFKGVHSNCVVNHIEADETCCSEESEPGSNETTTPIMPCISKQKKKLVIKLHYNSVMDEWISLTKCSPNTNNLHHLDKQLDIMFDLQKKIAETETIDGEVEIVEVTHFLVALEMTGIRRTDRRLKPMMRRLAELRNEIAPNQPLDSVVLSRNQFKRLIIDDIALVSRAFKNQFVIPEFIDFCEVIRDIYDVCKSNDCGQVASYIPQLARVDPGHFGISICTVDGQRFSIGDTNTPFTMQSSSKPFTYAVCLNELGRDVVHKYVGQEPSGRVFNELSLDSNSKPHNPLLNSGAIMSATLLTNLVRPEMSISEKFDFVINYLKRIGGGEYFGFNNSIFLSERETANRNYALGYYMKEKKSFPEGFQLQKCLDFYFQTCSIEINCETAAVMGATLANGGQSPLGDDEVLKPESVRDVLSLMHSCGMYNYSGEFAFSVGLPAKSGVSGCLILVVPNVMGIGIWSPPLDKLGNTVRGVQFCKEFIKRFNFHRFESLINQRVSKMNPRLFRNENSRQAILSYLYAATTGDLTALKRFHANVGSDLHRSNYDGRTVLHLASAEGHLSCVKFLIEVCKFDPQCKDRWGQTPKDEAKRFEHDKIVDYLSKVLSTSE